MLVNYSDCYIQIYTKIEKMILDLAEYAGLPGDNLNKYYVPLMQWKKAGCPSKVSSKSELLIKSEELSEEKILEQFARSLQNSGQMRNSIKFDDEQRYDKLWGMIADWYKGFNPDSENSGESIGYLYSIIWDLFNGNNWLKDQNGSKKEKDPRKSKKNLCKYVVGLYEAARYLKEKQNSSQTGYQLINEAIGKSFLTDFDAAQVILEKLNITKIRGLGPALSIDFLKESGCLYLPKPDTHLVNVVIGLQESSINSKKEKSAFKIMIEFAQALNKKGIVCTSYKLDKMIWLLCTGNFYLETANEQEGLREIRGFRDILIRSLANLNSVF